jgi:alpha-N-arabinofuranosidase
MYGSLTLGLFVILMILGYRVVEHITLTHPDLKATNTAARPDNVVPRANGDAAVDGGRLTASLPAASWNVIRLARV